MGNPRGPCKKKEAFSNLTYYLDGTISFWTASFFFSLNLVNQTPEGLQPLFEKYFQNYSIAGTLERGGIIPYNICNCRKVRNGSSTILLNEFFEFLRFIRKCFLDFV